MMCFFAGGERKNGIDFLNAVCKRFFGRDSSRPATAHRKQVEPWEKLQVGAPYESTTQPLSARRPLTDEALESKIYTSRKLKEVYVISGLLDVRKNSNKMLLWTELAC